MIFSLKVHQAILKGKNPQISKLPCGCEATVKKICSNYELIASIVYLVNQLDCLHQLAYLALDGLKMLGSISSITLLNKISVILPDFCDKECSHNTKSVLLSTMERVVLSSSVLQLDGWAEDQTCFRARPLPTATTSMLLLTFLCSIQI
jgi:hypothetical protein